MARTKALTGTGRREPTRRRAQPDLRRGIREAGLALRGALAGAAEAEAALAAFGTALPATAGLHALEGQARHQAARLDAMSDRLPEPPPALEGPPDAEAEAAALNCLLRDMDALAAAIDASLVRQQDVVRDLRGQFERDAAMAWPHASLSPRWH